MSQANLNNIRDGVSYIGRGHKGAACELLASAHLLSKGAQVFRSVSPHSPFDLVAYRNGTLYRVEVKAINHGGICRIDGTKGYSPPEPSMPTNDEWDLLVCVGYDDRCFAFEKAASRLAIRNSLRKAYGYGPARTIHVCSESE